MNAIRRRQSHPLPLLLLAAACASPPDAAGDVPLEVLRDPITSLSTDAEGDSWVGFGDGARLFVIPRGESGLLAVARDAFAHGTPVRATVRAGHGAKTPTAAMSGVERQRITVVRIERN